MQGFVPAAAKAGRRGASHRPRVRGKRRRASRPPSPPPRGDRRGPRGGRRTSACAAPPATGAARGPARRAAGSRSRSQIVDGLQAARVRALLAREELHRAARRGGRGTAAQRRKAQRLSSSPAMKRRSSSSCSVGQAGGDGAAGERGRGVRRIGIEIGGHALPNLAAAGVIGGGFEFVFHD